MSSGVKGKKNTSSDLASNQKSWLEETVDTTSKASTSKASSCEPDLSLSSSRNFEVWKENGFRKGIGGVHGKKEGGKYL
jgi:hypothetical protein